MKLMAASPSRKEERISRHLSLLGDADVDAQTRRGRVQGACALTFEFSRNTCQLLRRVPKWLYSFGRGPKDG